MKALLTLLAVLTLSICSARADVAGDLAALKKSVPPYPISTSESRYDLNDPLVRDCREKYTKAIAVLNPGTLKAGVASLKAQLNQDVKKFESLIAISEKGSASTGKQFQNARANAFWLRSKLAPFLDQLEALTS